MESKGVEILVLDDEANCKSSDAEPDETFTERILGLSEMVPPEVLDQFKQIGNFLLSAYRTTCEASWIFFMTVAILYGPVLYETERQRELQAPKEEIVKNSKVNGASVSSSPKHNDSDMTTAFFQPRL